MNTGRRNVIKMMAGAALYSAIRGNADVCSIPCSSGCPGVPVLVTINGSFILEFRKDDMLLVAPTVQDHLYYLQYVPQGPTADQCKAPKPPLNLSNVDLAPSIPGKARSLRLTNVLGSKRRNIGSYQGLRTHVLAFDAVATQFDTDTPGSVQVTLPYPNEIWAHRLMDVAFETPAAILRRGVAAALVLKYMPDPKTYKPTTFDNDNNKPYLSSCASLPYYLFNFLFGADDDSAGHARMAWQGVTDHFGDLQYALFLSDYTSESPNPDPVGLQDSDLECFASQLPGRLRAAHCKSPAAVVTAVP